MKSTHDAHTKRPRVIGYIRVSTEDQHLGPEAQKKELEDWCAREGLVLEGLHSDLGVSGGASLDKRPALLAAVDDLQAGDVLLVAKRDRLARDVMVSAMVERLAGRKGASVRSCTGAGDGEGPEALLMKRLVDAFAEYERELIRARTRSALAVKKSKNERVGSIPYGSRLASDRIHLEPAPEERAVLHRIRQLRGEGVSIRKVAARLNQEGVPARGSRWHATTIARVLRANEVFL